ncbi:hypothetical protein EU245_12780 [Lentibacillus lipolyticus]|nr:hypothetical protein EU245_12780 [Lentibacillus lipolyticus]
MRTKTEKNRITEQHLAAFYQLMLDNGDTNNAEKLLEVYEKWSKTNLMIGFAGHFSAGKSSMIDYLLGTSILPKSPIPTSANVVMIQSGQGGVRLYFDDGTVYAYEQPYDMDIIKDFARTKGNLKKIGIDLHETSLPDGCTVIDTPGIDAADDADRLITESSLHLLDVLFYVMDYNHVQSEVNLQFLTKVQDYGIPVFIIINQIDKHNAAELPFEEFAKKIEQTFDQWNLNPEAIYYSSLKDRDLPENEISAIKARLFALMTEEKQETYHIDRSVEQLKEEHKQYLRAMHEHDVSSQGLQETDAREDLRDRMEHVNKTLTELKAVPQRVEDAFMHELKTTLNNAYLMPAELREKARLFLEAQQKDFKVGWLGSKKKTEAERTKRSEDFLIALQENMETSIRWKLRDKWTELLTYYQLQDPLLIEEVQNITLSYDTAMLRDLIKPGAKITGDYVLVYTGDVSADVKQKFKQKAMRLLEEINSSLAEKLNQELVAYEAEWQTLDQQLHNQATLEMLERHLHERCNQLDHVLSNPQPSPETLANMNERLHVPYETVNQQAMINPTPKPMDSPAKQNSDWEPEERPALSTEQLLDQLSKTMDIVSELPGFQTLVYDLQQKHERLHNRTYTIALFGAFSAGKSSFANALMGGYILPASPNPTTAVINRINPVNDTYGHGTAIVTMKDETVLKEDIENLVRHFAVPEATSVDDLVAWIKEQRLHMHDGLEKTSKDFLQAVLEGYKDMRANLAQELVIPVGELKDYVTDEQKASFIASVDLYYDCPVTRQGITLVDTPGADSVNARHTSVAFDYIKYADAIFYVTYYNHAFAKADRDFLLQLGRVKESFQNDKMFFVMNASDLAADQAELESVRSYIEEQLITYGIRFPKLYTVSSKQSLDEKMNGTPLNRDMAAFEESFDHFIHEELTSIAKQSAVRDMHRALEEIRRYIDALQWDEEEKEQFQASLKTKETALKQLANELKAAGYTQKISQKLEKQLYYVLERLSIRFHDLFKETFNPATITDTGKGAQEQLVHCLRNLLHDAGYELMQELRAVSLRMEAFITDLKQEIHHYYVRQSKDVDAGFTLPDPETPELETPLYEQAFQNLGAQTFQRELKLFKGTKAFFAKNEKEVMKEALLERLYPYAKEYLDYYQQRMEETYLNQWNAVIQDMQTMIRQHVDSYIDRQTAMLTEQPVDMETLSKKSHTLETMLREYEGMET